MKKSAVVAALVAAATLSNGQDWQFAFDAPGNLLNQTSGIISPPQILAQPQPQVVAPGALASFFVVAANTSKLSYQWRFNGTNIGGATGDALLLQNVGATNEGQYSVVLTNSSGSVTSTPAALMLDADGDGLPDSWELASFGNLTNTTTGDFDGDGVSNLTEFLDGTSPTNNASALLRLTVQSDGGLVTVSPDRLSYTNGEIVTLTATPFSSEPFNVWTGDTNTSSNPLNLTMTNNKTLFAHFGPLNLVWTNNAGGSWHVVTNWSPNLVPGANDNVTIDKDITVTVNSTAQCGSLTLGSPSSAPVLSGTGNLTLNKSSAWASGTMSGVGRTIIATAATLNLANATTVTLAGGRILENAGTVLWTGANLSLNSSSVITNRAGALFETQGAGAVAFIANGERFDNAGTFRKSVNPGTTTVNTGVNFNNYGTVEIQTGTLLLDGGGTNTGSFEVPVGSTLEFSGNTFTLNSGVQLDGGGLYRINGGTVNCNTDLGLEDLDLVSATLGGSGTVTVNHLLNWTGGTMNGAGRTFIPAAARLNIFNASTVTLTGGRTLENAGTVLWTGAGFTVIGIITNRAGAVFEIQGASAMNGGIVSSRFDNAGILRKSVNPGTTTLANVVGFNNYGTVDILSGILVANGGFVSTADSQLNCAIGGTTVGTGYGRLQVAGTVTLNGALGVSFANGFLPTTNDSFTVLTAGTRSGTFANFYFPSNEVTMALSNSPTSVFVRVNEVLVVPRPVLLTPEFAGPELRLIWTAISNTAYRLESNPDLNSSNWIAVPGDVVGLGNTASKLDALTSSNRLYRVRVLP